MLIELKKFGDILTSREAGKEALSAFSPTLNSLGGNEKITIDFQGVSVLTPSWADEFMRPILEKYTAERVLFINGENPSVQSAMRFANPKLNLKKITVFQNSVVFDEEWDGRMDNSDAGILTLTFPYSDEDALQILKNNNRKEINLQPVDGLRDSPTRLKELSQKLNQAGIETTINK